MVIVILPRSAESAVSAGRHLPRRDRARIEERAIDDRAGRVHAAADAGRAHARTLFVDSLNEMNGNAVTHIFGDARTQFGFDRQLVRSIAKGHERALEWMTVDGPLDLHESSRIEVLCRTWHDDVGPPALARASLQRCGERLVESTHGSHQTWGT